MFDVIIIGASAAGCSAAIYLARRNINFKLVSFDFGGEMVLSGEVSNYPGLGQTNGIELAQKFSEHLELYMAFSVLTPLGWLERCPTYKEQMRELKDRHIATYAFLGYPVLQAADICLYKANVVPVGDDQLPHLELTREIVRKFNNSYKEIFPEPKPLLTQVPRLLGLDGRKMSKSYNNFVALSDAPDVVTKKIQSMFTDPKRIRKSDPGHPDKCNVHHYFSVFAPEMKEKVDHWCRNAELGCTDCKKILSEELNKRLAPLQEKRKEYIEDKKKIEAILERGRQKASAVASATLKEVKEVIGFLKCHTK